MSEIFDLKRIAGLIEKEKPALIVIVDTGVMLEEPALQSWKIGKEVPLFVLPCSLEKEIEHLKNLPISHDQACLVETEVKTLCENKLIHEGIFKEPAGWFISPPEPQPRILKSELAKIPFLSRSLGQLNSQLVVLTQEIRLKFLEIPLGVITRDINLFNILQFMGIQVVLYEKFPIAGFPVVKKQIDSALNWDNLLQDIQAAAEKNLVSVELTLSSKSLAPKWLQRGASSKLVIAEGKGVVHTTTDVHFSWTLPFQAWDFPLRKNTQSEKVAEAVAMTEEIDSGTLFLDFAGVENALPSDLYHALVKKINICTSPLAYIEEMPTLQDPVAILKQFLIFEYVSDERKTQGDVAQDSIEELEQRLADTDSLLSFAYYWMRERDASREEVDISFSEFLNALQSCWNIGQSIKFEIMRNETVNNDNIKQSQK